MLPGRNGLEPDLSISYQSRGDKELLAKGWSLHGFPAIVKMPRDRGLLFDGYDYHGYASNGFDGAQSAELLIPVGDEQFATGAESWQRFEPIGNCATGSQSREPCSWRMRDGNGRTYYFGQIKTTRYDFNSKNGSLSDAR